MLAAAPPQPTHTVHELCIIASHNASGLGSPTGRAGGLTPMHPVRMHKHFPHIVDCQPIPLEKPIIDAGFTLGKYERMELFTMPVAIVVAI